MNTRKSILIRIDVLNIEVQKLMKDITTLAESGMIHESLLLADEVEKLKNLKHELISIALNPDLASKQMKVCHICGAKQALNDLERKNKGHLEGKLHNGFDLLRKELKKMKNRLEVVKIYLSLEN